MIGAKEPLTRTDAVRGFAFPWQWVPIGIFTLFTALNMLDRQLLAALAPIIKREFHLSNAQFGGVISAFYAVSGAASPLAGLLVDRIGLRLGASLSMLVWSMASAATGWTRSLSGLIACRVGLGSANRAAPPRPARLWPAI